MKQGGKKEEQVSVEGVKESVERGKAFKPTGAIVDSDGRPISIEPVKPEALPPFKIPITYTISTYSPEQSEMKPVTTKKRKVARVAGTRTVDDSSHFTATVSLVTQLADNLRFPLSPGVSLRANGALREGPPLDEDPRRMSRQQYFSKNAEITKRPMTNVGVTPTGDGRPPSSADYDGSLAPDDLEVSDEMLAMTSRFADLDMLEGGREIVLTEPEREEEMSEVEVRYASSNLHNSSSPKPSLTLPRKSELGATTERPRDRGPLVAQIPPSERKRLPAPNVGRSIGHGLQAELFEQRVAKHGNEGDAADKVVTKREDILRALFR